MEVLKDAKRKAVSDQRPHDARVPFTGGRSGFTVLVEPNSLFTLKRKLLALARIAKYKSRADEWLALGCVATSSMLVDAMVFSKDPWRLDPELEELSKHLRGKLMTPSGAKIGRNQACPCNSGKKFKYCHGK
jgi:SEC-C motif